MNHKSREGFRCLRLQWLGRFLPQAGLSMFRPDLPVIGWYRQCAKLGFLTSTIIQWCYTLKHFMVVVPNETEAQWLLKGWRPGEIASARQRLCRKSWSLKHPETSAAFWTASIACQHVCLYCCLMQIRWNCKVTQTRCVLAHLRCVTSAQACKVLRTM